MKNRVSAPIVSVIVPCYNQGHFLRAAIESAIAQSIKEWELIVIDDGSTDDTHRIAREFQDPRIRYFCQENRGLAAARNAGIRASRTPLIALLDSDDLWEPQFLEKMVACLNQNPDAAAAYCGYSFLDSDGNKIGVPCTKTAHPGEFRRILLGEGNWLVPSTVVFRKLWAEQVGLFDESLRAVEDSDLWIRLSKHHDFVGIKDVLAGYRLHEANMSKDPEGMVNAYKRTLAKRCDPSQGMLLNNEKSGRDLHVGFCRYAAWKYGTAGNFKMMAYYYAKLFAIADEVALGMKVWRSYARLQLPPYCQSQPLTNSDLERSERNIANLLNELAESGIDATAILNNLSRIKSRAFLALAEESVHSHLGTKAIAWLWRAAAEYTGILVSRSYWGTVARLLRLSNPDND